ncbi:glycosyl hydrolase family 28-related protein [Streptomyces sp. CoH17]|uniref:glycosyl hydrolase family 28-related protein n=1 Tax=Streptomyces sp. CoH17 TaxID=2992806 RepID=UPI00226FE4DA|nr:glycosyl hydrolase family 28-related protein [Streptomyces sp. CoH17]
MTTPPPSFGELRWDEELNAIIGEIRKQISDIDPGDKVNTSSVGAPNGVAPLDSNSKVPLANIPDLADKYLPADTQFPVTSINTRTGDVTLTASDVGAMTQNQADKRYILKGNAPVSSVNGKTGNVELVAEDVGALPTGSRGATNGVASLVDGKVPSSQLPPTPPAPVSSVNNKTGSVTLNASDVGALTQSQADVRYVKTTDIPVTSVNGETGAVDLSAADVGAVPSTEKGVANGVATLGEDGKVLSSQLPTPQTSPVTSVNNKTGAVTLNATDVGALTKSSADALYDAAGAASAAETSATSAAKTYTDGKVTDLSSTVSSDYVKKSDKGVANGVASLGSDSKVTPSQIPFGTSADTVAAGNDSRFTNSRTPTGTASGDLSGSYPNPSVTKINGVSVSGTPTAGQIPTASTGTAASWQSLPSATTSQSGVTQFGAVANVKDLGTKAAGSSGKAADAEHVHQMPRLDQVQPPTAAVSMNSQKLTGLSNGTASTDAAAFGQIPVAGTGAGNYAAGNDSRITGAAQRVNNLSDLTDTAAARTNLGLTDVASSDFGNTTGTVAAGDDPRFQDSRTPSGNAGGDLGGQYPNPTVNRVGGVTISGTPTAGQQLTATSGTAATWQAPTKIRWFDVKSPEFGAKGDGTTNDQPAIQSAVNAAFAAGGGVVYFPDDKLNVYLTKSPITVPPGVKLMGDRASYVWVDGIHTNITRIKGSADFVGNALIKVVDKVTGGYTKTSSEQRFSNLILDGSALPANVDGLRITGVVVNGGIENVTVYQPTGIGVNFDWFGGGAGYSWKMQNVTVDNPGSHGFYLNQHSDLNALNCISIGAGGFGWYIDNCPNSMFTACRSEWADSHGFNLAGHWGEGQGSGGAIFTSCSTDRNGFDGMHIEVTGNPPIQLNGMSFRRDGRNNNNGGGGYAGLALKNVTVPIVVNDITCYPGVDDDGTGASSPDYGISVTGSSNVLVNGGSLHGTLAGVFDNGTNVEFNVTSGTMVASGPSQTPVRSVIRSTPGYRYVASSTCSLSDKSLADYVCDGVADEVQIQAAIDSVQAEGGGVVQLSPGRFKIAATIQIKGTKNENNARTVSLKGCGQQVTGLEGAAGVTILNVTDWAQTNIEGLGFFVSSTGVGLKSVGVNNASNNNNVSFWHSSFRNLRFNGGWQSTSTNWAMDLGMPWRSTFENIEVEGFRNGIRIINNATMQNAGDCVFSRFFVEIVGDNGYALYIESIDGNMNQNTWIDFEAGANGAGCTGIWLGGAVGTASQKFIGNLNLEQFQTLINVANGDSNFFDCNYVTCDTGGAGNKGFVTGANSYNNTFRSSWFNIAGGDTTQVIEDANNTSNAPNIFERIRFENNTGSTITFSKTNSTVLRDITTFNTGNPLPAGLLQYPLTTVNNPTFMPADHGLITWTHDPATLRSSSNSTTSGTVYLCKVKVSNRATIATNILIGVETAGTGLVAGQCFVGLYSSSGTLLSASADQSTAWATGGLKTIPLSAPQTLAVGSYYVAILANGTTAPQFAMGAGGTTSVNAGLTTGTARFLTGPTAQTVLPASIAIGGQSPTTGARWAALS